MKDRRYLRAGCYADLTVFSEDEVRSAEPDQEKHFGIWKVFINGQLVLDEDTLDVQALHTTGRAIPVGK